MADRPRSAGAGGAFDPTQPYKTFYFVLLLAIVFTVKDLYLSEPPATADSRGRKMSSESGSDSDGGMEPMDESPLRQRLFENEQSQDGVLKKAAAGSMLSAGKLNGPVMKFMYCTS